MTPYTMRMTNLLHRHAAAKRVYIKTYGCQMNEHDSMKIEALLAARGYVPTISPADADLVLFNTCTIREKAEHKAMSDIGRTREWKRANLQLIVGVCGCVAQQEKEALFKRFPHIDLLFGPDQLGSLPELLDEVAHQRAHVSALDLINTADKYNFLDLLPWGSAIHAAGDRPIIQGAAGPAREARPPRGEYAALRTTPLSHAARGEHVNHPPYPERAPATAFVTIMKGCDQQCTYCIVPKVRGAEVCRPAEDIIAEVRQLAKHGVKEITLLGQTVNTYGTRRHTGVISFHELLRRIADETAIERIRFTSPHPKDVTMELAQGYRDNPKLCPHIHLPLQAGSDRVLRSMRRAYATKHYLAKVDQLRAARPDIAITTDIIVGFPGETEADFHQTLAVVHAVQYDGMYAFAYSQRPGTEAATRDDTVTDQEKSARLAELLAVHEMLLQPRLAAKVGTEQQVLIEGRDNSGRYWTGRTPHNTIVHARGDSLAIGATVPVTIRRALGYSLQGDYAAEG